MIRDYLFPCSLKEAFHLKKQLDDQAVFVAGGTDLFIQIAEKKTSPEYLIDLTRIQELSAPEKVQENELILGACLPVEQLSKSPLIQRCAPSLSIAAGQLGSPAIRRQATIGGNLVNASPAADLIPPLIAQGSSGRIVTSSGSRSLQIEELAIDVNKTNLQPSEIVTHISVPVLREYEGTAYVKLGLRNALSISVASVAIWLRRKKNGKGIEKIRIAMGSVAPRVIRGFETEAFLLNNPFKRGIVNTAAALASQECRPISDIRASSEYRKSMICELIKIGLEKAWKESHQREPER
jgi:CO/xanthine dehydrogenase FAD-binding subunit